MIHNWQPIAHDRHGECAWVCSNCAQIAQARPVEKYPTEFCAKLFWKSLDKARGAC
jgi:hypothetical protein